VFPTQGNPELITGLLLVIYKKLAMSS
jgi:hypothetical protein